MRRKEVSKRSKSIAEVRASVGAHRARVGDKLDRRAAAQNVEAFSYQSFFDHMDRELAQAQRNLVTAEDDHVRQLVLIARLRRETRALTASVYSKQIAARRVLSGLYGTERQFELGAIEGRTPVSAQVLAEQVDQTIKILRDPGGDLPATLVQGVVVDFTILASDLEAEVAKLVSSSEAFQRGLKATDATRILTNKAITEADRVFPWVAGSLENCFRLADERELADRIRTSLRRVTRRKVEKGTESAESSTGGSSSGESSPDDSPGGASPQATSPATDVPANDVSAGVPADDSADGAPAGSGQGSTPPPAQPDADPAASSASA